MFDTAYDQGEVTRSLSKQISKREKASSPQPIAMASSSDSSPSSSFTSSPTPSTDQREDDGSPLEDAADDSFWSTLSRRAKSVLEDGTPFRELESKDRKRLHRKLAPEPTTRQIRLSSEGKWKRQDTFALHKGLEAIASSLSLLSDTIGTAIEEGLNLVETKATNYIHVEARNACLKNVPDSITPRKLETSPAKQVSSDEKPGLTRDTQLKASRDVAMAMATKAKLLLRELKGVKADLTFTRDRCAQLEEENKRLRENVDKGVRHEEDDLIRLQLETLLAEKARLAQENSAYARENQFLHEVVQYHRLTLQDVILPDESLIDDPTGLDVDSLVDMEFFGTCPQEKDISALEESVKISNQGGI